MDVMTRVIYYGATSSDMVVMTRAIIIWSHKKCHGCYDNPILA